MITKKKLFPVALASLALTLSACSSSEDTASTSTTAAASVTTAASASNASLTPFGDLCSQVPTTGEGSVTGMANDPVGTAASNNPLLTTLVTAVKKANLVDTLNGTGPFTVFAPVNTAFEKIPSADLNAILADNKKLTDILTYHVVAGKYTADQLTNGQKLKTVEGKEITITKSGRNVSANGIAAGCNDVPVGNGVVFLIPTVLTVPAS